MPMLRSLERSIAVGCALRAFCGGRVVEFLYRQVSLNRNDSVNVPALVEETESRHSV